MFTIAICDNEKSACEEIEKFIDCYNKENNKNIHYESFYSGEALYNALSKGISFDLIFLDIVLYHLSGIDVARSIREYQKDLFTQIVYFSAKREYALDLFQTHPLNFLLKPLKYDSVADCISKAFLLKSNHGEMFTFQINNENHRIPLANICYFESNGRKLRMVSSVGSEEFYGRIGDIAKAYEGKGFFKIHKSYIINLSFVDVFNRNEVTLTNGDVLPLSREHRNELAERLISRRFGEKGGHA